MPVLVPAILLATMTLSPTANAAPPARLVVLSAGDKVGAGEADRRRSDTLPEGLAVPTLEDIKGQQWFVICWVHLLSLRRAELVVSAATVL